MKQLTIALAVAVQFLFIVSNVHAGSDVTADGTALPGDGKSVAADGSKQTPVPVKTGCETPPDTEFGIGLPGWMAGMSGDTGVFGVIAQPDIEFHQLLSHLDMIASGSLYARYHRWEFSADGLYLRVSTDASLRGILFTSAHVAVKQAFAESFIGYRLINCQDGFLSIFAGGRYNYFSGDFRLLGARLPGRPGRHVAGSTDWVDPVVGAGGKIHIWKPVSFWAKGDVGGFGANSDFTWQVQGGIEIQVTRQIYSAVGWRYLKNDYASGGFTNKTELSGPYLETGITF